MAASSDNGYWLVTKHADVKEVSRRSDVFSSWQNGAIPTWPRDMTREAIESQRLVMLNMDAPHHTRLRKIISRGFTPGPSGGCRTNSRERAQNIAEGRPRPRAPATSSSRCPASCRCRPSPGLLGVPQEDRDKLFRWSNEMTGSDDPEYADVDPAMSSIELIMYAMRMAEERAKNPDRRHRHAR